MSTFIKSTQDGRKVEVIGLAVCLDGHKEATRLVPVSEHPNREAILAAVPAATHMAGRLPLTAEEAAAAQAALDAAREAYARSPKGLSERIRAVQNRALANRDG
ncbi:hypothetical protein MCA2835 [Methylococcus capsulatus str. Bath]|uniref:Uncharacterized protein n=1 Tax=Methylococcus capsulatus (strain ATCC 33009 / NCIMB 11132 / Bath) TaxID=243233 RepID=Q603H1_METCA|nr:hypothetical protein [Methylococcus capsulatus]AAU91015.1 hypothetical protein MCA2835 [Methylococcus capsulatus str. Bath]